jgi:hypothetical protein
MGTEEVVRLRVSCCDVVVSVCVGKSSLCWVPEIK